MVSSPPLGVCKQSTDESQLGSERPLTVHGAHQSLAQVWHRRLEVPRIQNHLRPGKKFRQSLPPAAGKRPHPVTLEPPLCLLCELREARWLAQGHTASWGQSGADVKSPSAGLVPSHTACPRHREAPAGPDPRAPVSRWAPMTVNL